MADFNLGKQVGPLPMGGWVVVIAGGLGIAYVINRNQASGSREPLVDPSVGTGLVPAGATIQVPAPGQGEGQTEPENNSAWGIKVTNWLIAQGHDPARADSAVKKYLSAESLTIQEQALISLALIKHGAPPESLPPVEPPTPPTEEDDPSLTPGGPQIQISGPSSVKRGGTVTFTGRVAYGATGSSPNTTGNPPKQPQLVTVQVMHSTIPGYVISTYFAQTDNKGNFTTRPGWTSIKRGLTRRYVFSWQGATKSRAVKIT